MKRKSFLQNTAAIIGTAWIPAAAMAGEPLKKTIRFAHLSDIHVKPGANPEAGMAKALQQVQSLKKPVDFIINGGDAIMDALEADKQKTQIQWDLFTSLLKKENSLPVYHTIGNHDIWGWFYKKDPAASPDGLPDQDKLYGKIWVQDILQMPGRYYSFNKGNWKLIVLDSTQLNPAGGYIARLDEEQMNWLQTELSLTPKEQHICIISHIPILSICAGLFFDKTETNGDLLVKRNLMHTDFLQLKKLFRSYPNIRACISGHIHLQEEIEYLGIRYYCNGAVSGNWWKGAFQEFEPAFAVMELMEDGSSKRTMVKYQVN